MKDLVGREDLETIKQYCKKREEYLMMDKKGETSKCRMQQRMEL